MINLGAKNGPKLIIISWPVGWNGLMHQCVMHKDCPELGTCPFSIFSKKKPTFIIFYKVTLTGGGYFNRPGLEVAYFYINLF